MKKDKVIVHEIESERGWGQRVDETHEFDYIEDAEEFCKKYNAKNNEDTVPDWYMYATIAYTPSPVPHRPVAAIDISAGEPGIDEFRPAPSDQESLL